MTHMMLDDDVQARLEADRMDLARAREHDEQEYLTRLRIIRTGPYLEDMDRDGLIQFIAVLTVLVDAIDAGEIE